jgi:hypothetical protein
MERDEEATFTRCRTIGDFLHSIGKSRIFSLPKINLRAQPQCMSPFLGTSRTWPNVQLESTFGEERKSDFGAVRSVDGPIADIDQYPLFGRIGDTADCECISSLAWLNQKRLNGDPPKVGWRFA